MEEKSDGRDIGDVKGKYCESSEKPLILSRDCNCSVQDMLDVVVPTIVVSHVLQTLNTKEYLELALARILELQREIKQDAEADNGSSDLGNVKFSFFPHA